MDAGRRDVEVSRRDGLAGVCDRVELSLLQPRPLREGQHTLVGVELTPVIGRLARLLDGADEILPLPTGWRGAEGLCPGLVHAGKFGTERAGGLRRGLGGLNTLGGDRLLGRLDHAHHRAGRLSQPPQAGRFRQGRFRVAHALGKGSGFRVV